jgi:hypothetical protein
MRLINFALLFDCIDIERRRLSETSCRKLELIDCYESAKLPVYVPKKKVEDQPLTRHLRSALQELNRVGSPTALLYRHAE